MSDCPFSLAAPPVPHPVCKAHAIPMENQTHVSTDVAYFNNKPFFHNIDDRTRWSEIGLLRTRRLQDQIYFFTYPSAPSCTIQGYPGDQEFNKAAFLEFRSFLNISFVPVTANHHEGNAIDKRENQSIREHVSRLALGEAGLSPVDLVTVARFHRNTSRGRSKSSSFDLLYNRVPKLSTICNPIEHGWV